MADADPSPLYVVVDADTLAGWRRPTSSLAQLHEAIDDLRKQEPGAVIAVIGDPSLKWALSDVEREEIELDISSGQLAFAPAGCKGGHVGFIGEVVARAAERGFRPVVITDQAVPDARLGRVRRDGTTWVFDLEGVEARTVTTATAARGHRRRR